MCGCNKAKRAPAAAPAVAPTAAGRLAPRVAIAPGSLLASASAPEVPSLPTVDTSVWGAALWQVLHTASVATRGRQHIQPWRNLINALKTGLPCPDCSAHYNAWVSGHGIRFSSSRDGIRLPIVRWVLDLHNDVNRRTGSPFGSWSVGQVMAAYQNLAEAQATLASLQGVIGPQAYEAAMALLRSL
jgi:hypothetical protein